MPNKASLTAAASTMLLVAAIGFISLLAGTELSHALPKKKSGECSAEQVVRWLTTQGGKACVLQQEQDVATNKPYFHAIFCGQTTAACCKQENNTGKVSECQVIVAFQPPAGTTGVGGAATGGAEQGVGGGSKGGTLVPSPYGSSKGGILSPSP